MTGSLPVQEVKAPPGKFISVFIAAKKIHAPMLVELRQQWPRLHFTARWPIAVQHASERDKRAAMWTNDNETDILAAETFVGFSAPEESSPLRDPLWELGLAHAHRKPIYLAGPLERFGSYAFCSSVVARFDTLDAALQRISERLDYESHADQLGGKIDGVVELLRTKFP